MLSAAATVIRISGQAFALRNGDTIQLEHGTPLVVSDSIQTEAGAKLEIRFLDGAEMALGPSTHIAIKDFAFDDAHQSDSSLAVHMLEGLIRSVSGKVVEQNADGFVLSSPMGTVGIRGTTTVHLISSQYEAHSVESVDAGHTVIIRTSDGRTVQIIDSLKTVLITQGDAGDLHVIDLSPQELQDYMRQLFDELRGHTSNEQYAKALSALLATVGGIDLTRLSDFSLIDHALYVAPLAEGPETEKTKLVEAPLSGDDASVTGIATNMIMGTTGNDILYAQPGNNILVGYAGNDALYSYGGSDTLFGGYGSQDTLYKMGDMHNTYMYGDDYTLPAAVTVDNDFFEVHGTMYSGAMYGDGYEIVAETMPGNDSVDIFGNIAGGEIYGDAHTVDSTLYGGDTVHITGDMAGGTIYGDAYVVHGLGGDNVIAIDGTLSGGEIYGGGHMMVDANLGASGNSSITIGAMTGGVVYGDAYQATNSTWFGNDVISVGTMSGGAIYGDAYTTQGAGGSPLAGSNIINVINFSAGAIYGSSYELTGPTTQVMQTYNTINLTGTMSGGELYGLAHTLHSVPNAAGGTPGVNVNIGTLSGGVVYLDAYEGDGGVAGKITIQNMTGGTVYADPTNARSYDVINITTMSGGDVYTDPADLSVGGGTYYNNTVNINTLQGGTIHLTGSHDLAVIDNLQGGTIDGRGPTGGGIGNNDQIILKTINTGADTVHCFVDGSDKVDLGALNLTGDSTIRFAGWDGHENVLLNAPTITHGTATDDGASSVYVINQNGHTLTMIFENYLGSVNGL